MLIALNFNIIMSSFGQNCCSGTFTVIYSTNTTAVNLTSQTVLLGSGVVLDVSSTVTFSNCTFVCCAGSQIKVEPDITLNLTNNNSFKGCSTATTPTLWQGILLMPKTSLATHGGTVMFDYNTSNLVSDAEYGIFAEYQSQIEILGYTLFDADYYGIYIPEGLAKFRGGPMTFDCTHTLFDGYTTNPGPVTLDGIYSNLTILDFTIQPGNKTFQNINEGIEFYNGILTFTGATNYHAQFENIHRNTFYPANGINGSAIYASNSGSYLKYTGSGAASSFPEIVDCDRAIRTRDIRVNLSGIYADDVINGFIIEGLPANNKSIDIGACKINEQKNGIQLNKNNPAFHVLVSGNTIEFGNSGVSGSYSGILVSETVAMQNPASSCVISGNNITFHDNVYARNGIKILNATNWDVKSNNVEINDNDAVKFGITLNPQPTLF